MTCAPIALAIWRAKIDTPPVPRTRTRSPAFSPPSSTSAPKPSILPWSGKRPRHGCSRAALAQTQSRGQLRSEEHTSELQSLMRISYAVFCLKKKKQTTKTPTTHTLEISHKQTTHTEQIYENYTTPN